MHFVWISFCHGRAPFLFGIFDWQSCQVVKVLMFWILLLTLHYTPKSAKSQWERKMGLNDAQIEVHNFPCIIKIQCYNKDKQTALCHFYNVRKEELP
jgi:hypothetical protein